MLHSKKCKKMSISLTHINYFLENKYHQLKHNVSVYCKILAGCVGVFYFPGYFEGKDVSRCYMIKLLINMLLFCSVDGFRALGPTSCQECHRVSGALSHTDNQLY